MAFSNIDRTEEVDACLSETSIHSTDYCRYYEKHPDTLLQRKECWTCQYSDFGIDTGNPSDAGLCNIDKKRKKSQYKSIKIVKG
jgi:hypothetical protein